MAKIDPSTVLSSARNARLPPLRGKVAGEAGRMRGSRARRDGFATLAHCAAPTACASFAVAASAPELSRSARLPLIRPSLTRRPPSPARGEGADAPLVRWRISFSGALRAVLRGLLSRRSFFGPFIAHSEPRILFRTGHFSSDCFAGVHSCGSSERTLRRDEHSNAVGYRSVSRYPVGSLRSRSGRLHRGLRTRRPAQRLGIERSTSCRGAADSCVGGFFHLPGGAVLSVVDTGAEASA
jgi:hypothetical protein